MRAKNQRVSTFPKKDMPPAWVPATIGDLVGYDGVFVDGDWVESKDQDPNGDVRLIQLADIGDGVYRNKSNRYLTYVKAIELGCTFLKPDDVLIARMPDPLGRACIFPGDLKPSVTAVDVCIVRTGSQGADHRWLMFTVNSPAVRSAIASLQSGSTRKRISRSNLAKLELSVPPLPEQHRIVAKIEELLTRLNAGVEALKKVKGQLKRFRQVVLKYAFEGKLTEEWRETRKDELEPASVLLKRIKVDRKKNTKGKLKELLQLDTSNLPKLPKGWVWTRLWEIAEIITGNTPSKKNPKNYGDYIPFVKPPELNDCVITGAEDNLSEGGVKLARILPPESVLVSCIGILGKTGINKISVAFNQQINAVIFPKDIMPKYGFYYFQTSDIKKWLNKIASATTIPIVNKSKFEMTLLPIPHLPEQHKIVEEIERRLSRADEVEKVVNQSLRRAKRLQQSILKKAFEGKLVPQDPSDEPAEKLLDRIKAEKAKREARIKRKRMIKGKKHERKGADIK